MEHTPQTRGLSWRILNTYHGHIYSLFDYLIEISVTSTHLDFAHKTEAERQEELRAYILQDSDPVAYRELLTTAAVARSSMTQRTLRFKIAIPSSSMAEIIDRAQARFFARSCKPSNVLTAGYRSAESRCETGKTGAGAVRQGITNYFVNTLITALQAPEWCFLLKRMGDAILFHLLTDTSIYVSLPNGCFCQLTGPPLVYTVPPSHLLATDPSNLKHDQGKSEPLIGYKRKAVDGHDSSNRQSKRRRTRYDSSLGTKKVVKPPEKNATASVIPLARPTMFFARAQHRSDPTAVHFGIPFDNILHRMNTRAWCRSKGLLNENEAGCIDLKPGDCNGLLEARHLSKYVFPLQYEMESVFSVHSSRLRMDLFARYKFFNRENEIGRKGPCKTPPRLKSSLPLLAQMFHRHTKCWYKAILDEICPSKLRPVHKDSTADSNIILGLISEDMSEELQTQMNYSINTNSTISISGRPDKRGHNQNALEIGCRAQNQTALKPKFAEYTCSYSEVYLYACAITREVIPSELWGCEKNREAVFHHVKHLISARRNEGMTLHAAMQGISTNECDWLTLKHGPNQSESEMLKRREVLQEFIFWYFDQFLLPLLRTTFYVTDSSAYRNRVLYFRQDDWKVLCQPLLDRLTATTFQRISQDEAQALLRQHKLGFSFVRLLPKDSGVRPIVNLRRKRRDLSDSPLNRGQSINQILYAAFQILDYERKNQEKLGASVFGPVDSYLRLKQFKSKIADATGKLPKLYFVKVDVQACFDTIEQGKLLGILKEIISEDVYMTHKYGKIASSDGRIQRRFVRNIMPEYEHPHFLTYAKKLAATLRHAIFVDQVVYPFAFQEEIIELLEEHITSNIVKIGNDYYRQRVGIPQGSVLSTLLCSFFYGDLEKNILQFATDPQKRNVLLRFVDDYLFITTNVTEARRFLEVMNQGHPEYGCFISREKTLANFDHRVGEISQLSFSTVMHPDRKLFPWCGYLINTEDLSVMTDYSRFHDDYLLDSLTIERCCRPNAAFRRKMLQTSKAKAIPIFIDSVHNSPRAVRVNVYQAFVMTAMKMHVYIRTMRHDSGELAFLPRHSPPKSTSDESEDMDECVSDRAKRKKCSIADRKALRGQGAFLLKTIHECILYVYACIRNQMKNAVIQESFRVPCDLTKDEVTWLGTHAFHSILSKKHTVYTFAGVLGALQAELKRPRYNALKRPLSGIAKESLEAMLRDIRF